MCHFPAQLHHYLVENYYWDGINPIEILDRQSLPNGQTLFTLKLNEVLFTVKVWL